jgi:hypothetical protein
MAMNATFIQMKMHKQDSIRIFCNSQKGFVAGVPGCMEHAVMTRELMAHAIHNKRDLHMIQIDFTNAFGSVPHDLISHNMRCMGSDIQVDTITNIYEGASTVITVPTGAKMKRRQESEERWKAYCADQLKKLRELNQEEMKESRSGSDGHLLEHPDEVTATLAGRHSTSVDVHTLSERACEDDPSTIVANGSEGHSPTHPSEVAAILTGGRVASVDAYTPQRGT